MPPSERFIVHMLDPTNMFVQPHVAYMIRSKIGEFRDQNSYEKPQWRISFYLAIGLVASFLQRCMQYHFLWSCYRIISSRVGYCQKMSYCSGFLYPDRTFSYFRVWDRSDKLKLQFVALSPFNQTKKRTICCPWGFEEGTSCMYFCCELSPKGESTATLLKKTIYWTVTRNNITLSLRCTLASCCGVQ